MRLKVTVRGLTTSVCDADTGEELPASALSLEVHGPDFIPRLTVTVIDFDAEIEADADADELPRKVLATPER